jgi:hypothetical protein
MPMDDGPAPRPGPLVELLRHIEQTSLRRGGPQADKGAEGAAVPAVEPGDLRYFRSTWSRLRVERQLTQSQSQVPENAGPLNSDRLVLRVLQTLREVSPAYLNRYVAYLDALMWLDQARAGGLPTPVATAKSAQANRAKPDPHKRKHR